MVNKAVVGANKAVVAKKEAAARETKAAADKVAKRAASKATAELTINTKRVMSSAEFVTRFHLIQSRGDRQQSRSQLKV